MYDHILFPTDGSDGADAVFAHVLDIATRHGATVHILNVADTTRDSVTRIGGGVVDALAREGERIVDETADRATARSVSTVTDVRQGGVSETIAAYAEEYDIDLVTMSTQGRTGFTQLVLGSVTERVIRQSTVPVLALHPDEGSLRYPYRTVLLPTDGSACAEAALDRAVTTANTLDATLHLLSVVDTSGLSVHSDDQRDTLTAQASRTVESAAETAGAAGVDSVVETTEESDSVPEAVAAYTRTRDVDLVVMGTRGRSNLSQRILGSTTEQTVRTVPVPVLTVSGSGSDDTSP